MSTGPFSVLRWGCLLHGGAELGWGGGEVKAEERRDGCPAFLTGPGRGGGSFQRAGAGRAHFGAGGFVRLEMTFFNWNGERGHFRGRV